MSKTLKEIPVSVPKGAENIRTSVVEGQVKKIGDITTKAENYEEYFSVVEASKLSLDDVFLKHEPKTENQKIFKQKVINAIKSGLSDFKAQCLDPSVDEDCNIYYKLGSEPGIGYSVKWWSENALKLIPGKSRNGTTVERIAFLAVLIKKGLATWEQICDDSEEFGKYMNFGYSKYYCDEILSRPVGEFYDVGKTCKITENKETGGFSLVGGVFDGSGYRYPLADVGGVRNPNNNYNFSVGWIVLDI